MGPAQKLTFNKRFSPGSFQALFVTLRMVSDIGLSFASPVLAYLFRFNVISPHIEHPPLFNYLVVAAIFAGVNFYFFIFFGTYKPVRGRLLIDEIFAVVKVYALGILALLAIAFFVRSLSYSRLTLTYTIVLSFILLGGGRALLLLAERALIRKGHGHKNLLVVGTGQNFSLISSKITVRPELGFTVVGYLEEEEAGTLGTIPLIGKLDELEKTIVRKQILILIVALRPAFRHIVPEIVDLCDRYGVECFVSPDLEQMIVGAHRYDEIAGIPVVRIKGLRMRGFSMFMKRAFDLVSSILITLFVSPFFLMIAFLIKLDSPGPIFYMQKRIGMDGEEFWMFKFRSMRTEAEAQDGPAWSQDNDPRVTKLGNLLRKLSIDEFPQLFNVIKGEMSLVGPRPERAFFVEQFRKVVPRYMERHTVKTGMTGWAQVNGLRGDTSIEERVNYDLYYIENWSLWFDLKIIVLTVVDILKEITKFINKKRS